MDHEGTARYRGHIILCAVLSLIVGGVVGYFTPHPQPSAPVAVVSTPFPTTTPLPTPTPAPIRIHVSGAVRTPDVYELPLGSIVRDAVEAAGGPTGDADLDHINLAVELRDQQQVYVPRQGEKNPPPPISGNEPAGGPAVTQVNINTATAAELETLPRIGPTTAQRILEYREVNGPFETIEDIQNVPGIGSATFKGFEALITVRP